MKLIAKQSVFYAGRTRRKGEVFDAPEVHARLLLKTRQVLAYAEPEAEQEPAVRTRRQYRRRDLRAEV